MEGPAPRAAQPGQPLSLSSRSSLGPAVRSSRPEPASASRQHQRLCRARTHGSPASLPRLLTAPCVLCFLKLFGIVLTRTLQIKEGKQHFLNQQRPLGGVHWGHEPLKSPAETGSASASLSPEEQRVLERKRKKERKKEARRRLREAGVAAAPSPAVRRSGAALALQYLRSWAQKHEDWRFQKTRQTWLLSHMYDRDQVWLLPWGWGGLCTPGGPAGGPVSPGWKGRAGRQRLLGPHWTRNSSRNAEVLPLPGPVCVRRTRNHDAQAGHVGEPR
nr:uncharacterized protein C7orf50 homolog isoform X1 [Ovis aries]